MITLENIKEGLKQQSIFVTDEEINAELVKYDQPTLVAGVRAGLTVRVWDKVSPINGVDAQTVLANRPEINEDTQAYLIDGEDGNSIYFQTHKPGVAGFEPIEDVLAEGNAHADEIAEQWVDSKIAGEIIESMKKVQANKQESLVLELIERGLI